MLKFLFIYFIVKFILANINFHSKKQLWNKECFSCLLIKFILLWINWRSNHETTFYGFHYNNDYNYVKYNDTSQVPDNFIKNVM